MNNDRNHILYGFVFVGVCIVVAAALYIGLRSGTATTSAATVQSNLADIDPTVSGLTPSNVTGASQGSPVSAIQETAEPDTSDAQMTANVPSSVAAVFPEYRFADYPAPAFEGPAQLPTFTGSQKGFADYRTALTAAAREKPSFAGSVAVASVGCGSGGCVRYFFIDTRSGGIVEHQPANAGKDDVQYDTLETRPDSILAYESFQRSDDSDQTQCVYNAYRWDAGRLVLLGSKSLSVSPTDACTSVDQ